MDWRTKVELFEEIRREYEFGIGTIAGVAKKLKVHRRMVREAIGSALPAPRKKTERPRWKLAGAVAFVDGILELDRKAPRKQRHTAHRIWERMRAEMQECSVCERTVRQVRPGAQASAGPGGQRSVCAAELRLGRGSAGGLVRSRRRSGWGADQTAGVLHAEYGQWRSVPLRFPARHAAGVPGSARTGLCLLLSGCFASSDTTT